MLRKNNIFAVITGVFIAVFLGLIYDYRFSSFIGNKTYLFLFFSYGGVVSFDEFDFFCTLLFSIPFIFNILLFGNYLHQDFDIALVYIFTRKDSRNKWLLKRCFLLDIRSWFYYIVQYLTIVVVSVFKGYSFNLVNTVTIIFMLTVTLTNINNFWLLVGCILSIKKSSSLIVFGMLGLYIGWIFLLPVTKDSAILLNLMPISRSLLSMHELPYYLNQFHLNLPVTLTILSTCLWGITARSILYFLSIKWIKNINLI